MVKDLGTVEVACVGEEQHKSQKRGFVENRSVLPEDREPAAAVIF